MPIREFVQRQLASAAVGTPGVDRSGEVLGAGLAQAGAKFMEFQERQKRIDNSLEVLDMMNRYETTMLENTTNLKAANMDNPENAIKDYAELSSTVTNSPQFNTGTNRELGLAFRQMAHTVDRGNANNIARWTVQRKNALTTEKLTNAVTSSADIIGEKVRQGATVDILNDEMEKFGLLKDSLGSESTQQLLSAIRTNNPGVDITKMQTGITQAFVTKYADTQITTNPGVLLGELSGGKFDGLLPQEDITKMKEEATNAMLSQSKDRFTTVMLGNVAELSKEMGRIFQEDFSSPDLGTNESISNAVQGAEVLRVGVERGMVILNDLGTKTGADVSKQIKAEQDKLKTIDTYKQMLVDTRSVLNKYGVFKPKPDPITEGNMWVNLNRIVKEADDDPDRDLIIPVLEVQASMADTFNRGKISKETYKSMLIKAIPLMMDAVADRHSGVGDVTGGMNKAFDEIELNVKNFVSKDEFSPFANSTKSIAYNEFWRAYSKRKQEGVIFTSREMEELGEHATVLAMLKDQQGASVIPEQDRGLVFYSGQVPYIRDDEKAGISITITKNKNGMFTLTRSPLKGYKAGESSVGPIFQQPGPTKTFEEHKDAYKDFIKGRFDDLELPLRGDR